MIVYYCLKSLLIKPFQSNILVGGGTAGCVLANRLSERADVSILLLEAGQDDRDHPTVPIPFKTLESAHTTIDWDYSTVSQKHALKAFKEQVKSDCQDVDLLLKSSLIKPKCS